MARQRSLSAKEVDAERDAGMHWVSDNLYLPIREPSTSARRPPPETELSVVQIPLGTCRPRTPL